MDANPALNEFAVPARAGGSGFAALRASLKQSPALVGIVRWSRQSIWKARGSFLRSRRIRQYLASHPVAKINIGAGPVRYPGWLAADYSPIEPGAIFLDATKKFPFPDESIDYIYSEHMIEHVPLAGARAMLSNCHVVLRSGGRLRLATPDLVRLRRVLFDQGAPEIAEYIRFSNQILGDDYARRHATNACIVFNRLMHDWGHQFIYDQETLTQLLEEAGFVDIRRYEVGKSEDAVLMNLETHWKRIGGKGADDPETMVLEGSKR